MNAEKGQKVELSEEKEEHPCAGCVHFYGLYQNNVCCNYIFDMGRRRPCPFGQGCTVKRLITRIEDKAIRKGKFYI